MSSNNPFDHSGRSSAVLTGAPHEIPPLRRAVRDMASQNGFADRATDMTLALDELVANALRHGAPPVTVTAWYDGRLVLEVADVGPGLDAGRLPDRLPSRLGHGGRGLWILRQVCDHVTIVSSEHGTRVRVEMTHEPQLGA